MSLQTKLHQTELSSSPMWSTSSIPYVIRRTTIFPVIPVAVVQLKVIPPRPQVRINLSVLCTHIACCSSVRQHIPACPHWWHGWLHTSPPLGGIYPEGRAVAGSPPCCFTVRHSVDLVSVAVKVRSTLLLNEVNSNQHVTFFFYSSFFFQCLFLRHRERQSMSMGGAERGGDTES